MKFAKRLMSMIICILLIVIVLPSNTVFSADVELESTSSGLKTGDVFELGYYPKTRVLDESLINALNAIDGDWLSYNYYEDKTTYSDYMQYKDVSYKGNKYRAVTFSKYRPWAAQKDNGYMINEVYWFLYEPIQWVLLDSSTGLATSVYALDSQAYNHTGSTTNGYYANNYEKSDVRKWLYNVFYMSAFGEYERQFVLEKNIDNKAWYSKYSSASTKDSVFLLSRSECNSMSIANIEAVASDYANIQGCPVTTTDIASLWLLRTAGGVSYGICYYTYGSGSCNGYNNRDDAIFVCMGIRPAIYLDLNAYNDSDTDNILGEVYPENYDFFEDSYSFSNYGEKISKKYFTTIYEDGPGSLLYDIKKNSSKGGLCFGMAYTSASIYNGLPDCSRISTLDDGLFEYKFCNNLREAVNYNLDFPLSDVCSAFNIGDNTITIEDYIKYAFIYQWSSDVATANLNTFNDVQGLYNKVVEFTDNNTIGVTIGLIHYDVDENGELVKDSDDNYVASGHEVLAVGYDGNDILIDDPNNTDSIERLTINEDWSWSYSGAWTKDGVNSGNSILRYQVDCYRPYQILLTGDKATVNESIVDNQTKVETYIENMNAVDSNSTLLYLDVDSVDVLPSNAIKVMDDCAGDVLSGNGKNLFWVKDSNVITMSNVLGEDNTISVAGDDKIITLKSNQVSEVGFDVNKTAASLCFTGKEQEACTISYSVVDSDLISTIEINGEVLLDKISIESTDDGMSVKGLSNGKITLVSDGVVMDEEHFTDNNKSFNIVYDNNSDCIVLDNIDDETTEPNPTEPSLPETDPNDPSTGEQEGPTDTTEPTEPNLIEFLGDANGDGKVNVKDATEIQKAVAGLLTLDETEESIADVDSSGIVNVKDATAIQKWIAGIETGFLIGEPVKKQ